MAPYFYAIKGRDIDMARALVAAGADMNKKDKAGWVPLDMIMDPKMQKKFAADLGCK